MKLLSHLCLKRYYKIQICIFNQISREYRNFVVAPVVVPIIVPAACVPIKREVRLESTLGSVRQISSILLQSVGKDGGNFAGKISTTRYVSSSEAPVTDFRLQSCKIQGDRDIRPKN